MLALRHLTLQPAATTIDVVAEALLHVHQALELREHGPHVGVDQLIWPRAA
jgi:hypothetical protein